MKNHIMSNCSTERLLMLAMKNRLKYLFYKKDLLFISRIIKVKVKYQKNCLVLTLNLMIQKFRSVETGVQAIGKPHRVKVTRERIKLFSGIGLSMIFQSTRILEMSLKNTNDKKLPNEKIYSLIHSI